VDVAEDVADVEADVVTVVECVDVSVVVADDETDDEKVAVIDVDAVVD
jgi:hypothetical protein